MSIANHRAILEFNNSVFNSSSLYSNFILILCTVYELNNWSRNPTNNFSPKNCLFGTVKSTRNADKSKFVFNGAGITFDGKNTLSYGNGFARKVVIFRVAF